MHGPHVEQVLSRIAPGDRVLDIGGWACPFNRANWVVDAEPWETRGFYKTIGLPAFQGGEKEHFTKDTWITRDICAREPFPFPDKYFDFVICSHTLEDIRDPIGVCSEIRRIGKRGYIEVPSRLIETCRGHESPKIAGLSHHRWLIEIADNRIRFLQKYHLIHSHWRFSFPPPYGRHGLKPEEKITFLWWENSFEFEESLLIGAAAVYKELDSFVRRHHPYPAWRYSADRMLAPVVDIAGRVKRRITG